MDEIDDVVVEGNIVSPVRLERIEDKKLELDVLIVLSTDVFVFDDVLLEIGLDEEGAVGCTWLVDEYPEGTEGTVVDFVYSDVCLEGLCFRDEDVGLVSKVLWVVSGALVVVSEVLVAVSEVLVAVSEVLVDGTLVDDVKGADEDELAILETLAVYVIVNVSVPVHVGNSNLSATVVVATVFAVSGSS